MPQDSPDEKTSGEKAGNALKDLLSRADSGLLALHFAAFTFVAGAEHLKLLENLINIQILLAGFCVGLLFSLLCIYFTIFGVRATATVAREEKIRKKFGEDLVAGQRGILRPIGVLGLPVFTLIAGMILVSVLLLGPERAKAIKATTAYQDCLWRAQVPERASRWWLVSNEAGRLATGNCKNPEYDDQEDFRGNAENLERNISYAGNILATIVLSFIIFLPFLVWDKLREVGWRGRSGLLAKLVIAPLPKPIPSASPLAAVEPPFDARPAEIERLERKRRLDIQIDCIQSYRTAAAVLSLGAFMLGIGLALINTSTVNVKVGIADSGASVGASADAARSTPLLDAQGAPSGTGKCIDATCGKSPPPPPPPPPAKKPPENPPKLEIEIKTAPPEYLNDPKPDGRPTASPPQPLHIQFEDVSKAPPPPAITFPSRITLDTATTGATPPTPMEIKVNPVLVQPGAKGDIGDTGKPGDVVLCTTQWKLPWPKRDCRRYPYDATVLKNYPLAGDAAAPATKASVP